MKFFLYPLILHTLLFASQSHSLLGFHGLIFTPAIGTFPKDGELVFGYRNIQTPYTFINWDDKTTDNHLFFSSLIFLPRFSLTGVITMAPGSEGNDGTDIYKDFALFAHIQLLKESERFPSVMLGIHDFYSYSYYNALFLSASRSFELNPTIHLNSHLGYGVDWMNQHYGDTGPDRETTVIHYLLGLFGGIEVYYRTYGSIIIEYDTHQINSGIRLNLFNKCQITAALLNSDTISFGVDYRFFLL